VSRFLQDETTRDFGVSPERIDVIPNFIDPEVFRPGKEPCHRATLAPGGEKIVMHVSNFRPVKRIGDVIEAFARIRREVPARLVLIGDGPERPAAQDHAERLGLSDAVLFLGKHASVDELLACADLFVLPSASESFGLAALEAMAAGAPVIASRAGGIPEVVPHGEAGFLLEVGDAEGMGEAGARLLGDPVLHERFAAAARRCAVERFSADRVVPMYEAHYRKVLEGVS
jgi:N-acetyl-alpha-D-glucosaminyl L-malate synthase BshA